MKGLFEMANDNTLLALAYIRESENPLAVFCNLILYCLSKSTNQELRHDELKNKMIETFGLTIPNHVINSFFDTEAVSPHCLHEIEKELKKLTPEQAQHILCLLKDLNATGQQP